MNKSEPALYPSFLVSVCVGVLATFALAPALASTGFVGPYQIVDTIRVGGSMSSEDDVFRSVQLNTFGKTECSPSDPGMNWEGIVIRAPRTVVLSRENVRIDGIRIPLCGFYRINLGKVFGQKPLAISLANTRTGTVYHGEAVEKYEHLMIPPPPSKSPEPEMLARQSVVEYFNYDISTFVAFPKEPATYDVFVEFGQTQSNVVRIVVTQEK